MSCSLEESLNFVKGGIRESDIVPVLGAIRFKQGRVTTYNGEIKLASTIPLQLEGTPAGTRFLKALNVLKDIQSITVEDGLWVVKGKGKTVIKVRVIDDDPNHDNVFPDGEIHVLKKPTAEALMSACKDLAHLISKDASRPWSQCIRIANGCARVTNNVIIVDYWLDFPGLPAIQLPALAVAELNRIGEPPSHIQRGETHVTFHWREKDRYLLTHLIADEQWPNCEPIFASIDFDNKVPLTSMFWEALETLYPFTEGPYHQIIWEGKEMTSKDNMAASGIDIETPVRVNFSAKQFLLLKPIIEQGSISPGGITGFKGPKFRGAISTFREGA